MTPYSFPSIQLNGRNIDLADILNGLATPTSQFEVSLFRFVTRWMEGAEKFVQQTSGSTGTPKSISISREQMIASAKLTEKALGLSPSDTALICLDPDYIAGKMMLVRSFVTNMRIVAISPSSNPIRHLVPGTKIDFAALVPMQLSEIVNADTSAQLNEIKKIIIGGATIPRELQKKLLPFRCEMYATYGMTETISHVALQRLNGSLQSDYFNTLPGVEIDTDNRGCLILRVPFLTDAIVTNDLVEVRDGDHFKWLGRVDNIINSGGVKIIPEKVESEILKVMHYLGNAQNVLVTSIADDRLGNKIIGLMEGDFDAGEIKKIKEKLPAILSPYEIPKDFFSIPMFVYTGNGKINRVQTTAKFIRDSHFDTRSGIFSKK